MTMMYVHACVVVEGVEGRRMRALYKLLVEQ